MCTARHFWYRCRCLKEANLQNVQGLQLGLNAIKFQCSILHICGSTALLLFSNSTPSLSDNYSILNLCDSVSGGCRLLGCHGYMYMHLACMFMVLPSLMATRYQPHLLLILITQKGASASGFLYQGSYTKQQPVFEDFSGPHKIFKDFLPVTKMPLHSQSILTGLECLNCLLQQLFYTFQSTSLKLRVNSCKNKNTLCKFTFTFSEL